MTNSMNMEEGKMNRGEVMDEPQADGRGKDEKMRMTRREQGQGGARQQEEEGGGGANSHSRSFERG